MSMSISMSRTALRRSTARLTGRTTRRFESNTSKASEVAKDAAAKASEKAAEFRTKAAEGLSRVSASAGPALSNAAKGVGNALGSVGGRTGTLIGLIERQVPSAVYYSRVGLELGKLVFHGQKMAMPPMATFQSYYQSILKSAQNPNALIAQISKAAGGSPANMLQQVRNLSTAQMVSAGVISAEVIGFFTVGEMIGRMKLVGYRGEAASHH